MIINADSLVQQLKKKVRPTQSDDSRHVLCPRCEMRTKLNILGDGRRKCTVCGKKFRIHKVTESTKLRQCSEILLCYCLDFSAPMTAQITHHPSRLIAAFYDHFRTLLGQKGLRSDTGDPAGAYREILRAPREKSWCEWCKSKRRSRKAGGTTPVFGVQLRDDGVACLDPLGEPESLAYFRSLISREDAPGCRDGYAGYVCCGKFHRFAEDAQTKGNAEQLWTWIQERILTHHVLWKRNPASYLKELEWKYNSRTLDPDVRAKIFIELMPADFLTAWREKEPRLRFHRP